MIIWIYQYTCEKDKAGYLVFTKLVDDCAQVGFKNFNRNYDKKKKHVKATPHHPT